MPPVAAPAAAAVAAGDGAAAAPAAPQRGGWLAGLVRMGVMWYLMRQFSGSGNKSASPGGGGGGGPDGASPTILSPLFSKGTLVDVHMFISENSNWKEAVATTPPVWVEPNVPLGAGEPRHSLYMYHPSPEVQNNGSVYIHAVITPPGASPNPEDDDYDSALSWSKTRPLIAFHPKPRAGLGINLLSGKNTTGDQPLDDNTAAHNETIIVSFLKPNMTLLFVDEFGSYPVGKLPPHYAGSLDVDAASKKYRPHTWFNEFWLLKDYLVAMNDTVTEVPIHLFIEPVGPWKFAFFVQMEQSFSMQQTWGMSSGSESDEVKRIFLEGNPLFLALTMAVSMLHSVFDMLAFKSDIGFWKDNKSMVGLSARTILINAGCQLVIFLYLLDNDTSFVVLMSTGVGTAIEFWKVTKAMDVRVVHTASGLPYVQFKDRASSTLSKTDQYDAEAMRYLSYALFPLIVGHAIYSLLYQTHKSWYSFVLNTLVSCVYMFGFILMCPQLYLNYKLKSVAHLPWRQMTYKFLNTILDDFFIFIIKMPMLHRLAAFRDDAVFMVYLYQRWIYRVDKSRPNEFGYVEDPTQPSPSSAALLSETEFEGGEDDVGGGGSEVSAALKMATEDVAAAAKAVAAAGSGGGGSAAAEAAVESKKEK